MAMEKEVSVLHPEGEQELMVVGGPNQTSTLNTFGGTIHVKWDETAAVTPFGQLAFFIEFLKTACLWDRWVEECPVTYESPNAPEPNQYIVLVKTIHIMRPPLRWPPVVRTPSSDGPLASR